MSLMTRVFRFGLGLVRGCTARKKPCIRFAALLRFIVLSSTLCMSIFCTALYCLDSIMVSVLRTWSAFQKVYPLFSGGILRYDSGKFSWMYSRSSSLSFSEVFHILKASIKVGSMVWLHEVRYVHHMCL